MLNLLVVNRFGVYHWNDYTFNDDTSIKDKYWIALNCTINQKKYYAILPTSQYEKYNKQNKFILTDTIILNPSESEYFSKKTVLDLKNLKTNSIDEIRNAFELNKFKYLGVLEKEIQNSIINTIKNAETLSNKTIKILLCEEV